MVWFGWDEMRSDNLRIVVWVWRLFLQIIHLWLKQLLRLKEDIIFLQLDYWNRANLLIELTWCGLVGFVCIILVHDVPNILKSYISDKIVKKIWLKSNSSNYFQERFVRGLVSCRPISYWILFIWSNLVWFGHCVIIRTIVRSFIRFLCYTTFCYVLHHRMICEWGMWIRDFIRCL